jgi:ABC-type polysaccharide/polyol phosphate export permease
MAIERSSYVYDSARRSPGPIEEFQQVLRYRYLIIQLLRRDILTRYKRSFLGVAWTMINPLGMMLVLSIVFTKAFGVDIPGYPAYILSGIMAWNFFAQTTTAAMVNLVWGGGLLKRIYMPRTSFALAAIGTGIVNMLFAFIPLIIVMLITGMPIRWTVIYMPISMLLMAAFSLGFGLLLSTFAVYFPDVAEMYQIALTAWMYLTPVIYPESILPESYRWWITHLNPMYGLIRLFRLPIYAGQIPTWGDLWPSLLISVGILALGWWFFSSKADEMAYRI